ncbi:MAG: DUF4139 domain-containing protein [Chitinophagales bacterium]|nr:DUF4139 domain-containing protein [Chitinophagales bacterium]
MKRILLSFVLLFQILQAQTSYNTKISEVTVYRNNAELVSSAKLSLPAGSSEIILKDISTSIDPSSLQVSLKTSSKVSLLSAVYEMDYINPNELNKEQQALFNQLETLNTDLRWAKEQKQIYYDLEVVLNENRKLGGANLGLNPQDLVVLLENYKNKQYEYNQAYLKYEKMEKELNQEITKLQNQLNQSKAERNKPSGQIKLQVSSLSPSTVEFFCTYIVANAGWSPIYDLRSEGIDKKVNLNYKANIYQNTGYDWNNVDLTVSTGNPVQNNNRPILHPLYADFYQYNYLQSSMSRNTAYKTETANMAYMGDFEMEEVMIDSKDGFAYNNGLSTTQFSTQFELSLPQSIPSDNKEHLVGLESYELESEYIYHAVPKLEPSAFLLAKVSNWGQYNLLPGDANIFFEGTYVGQSYIDPTVSSDTLLLSLGRDESIKISRRELKDFTSTKMIGSNKKESYTYEIEIKNNKSSVVKIEILDQIPVSSNKEIEIELEDNHGAKYNAELGRLEWNLSLNANQSNKLRFSYSVKYPKDKIVNGKK